MSQQTPFCRVTLPKRTWTMDLLWITLRDVVVRMTLFAWYKSALFSKSVATHSHCRKAQWGSCPALPPTFGFVNPSTGGGGCWVAPSLWPASALWHGVNRSNKSILSKGDKSIFFHHTGFFLLAACILGTSSGRHQTRAWAKSTH